MSNSANALYLTKHIRQCERKAIDELDLTEDELMLRAGTDAFNELLTSFSHIKSIAVFCGGGKNAGDGYILARLAFEHGLSVIVYHCKALEDLPPAAAIAAQDAILAEVPCQYWDDTIDREIERIVDALLGIGVQGAVRGATAHIIRCAPWKAEGRGA